MAALPGRLGLQHGGGEGAGEQAPENHNDQPLAIQRSDAGVTQFRCRGSSVWVGYLFEPGGVKKSGPPRPGRHHLPLVTHGLCLFPLCLLPSPVVCHFGARLLCLFSDSCCWGIHYSVDGVITRSIWHLSSDRQRRPSPSCYSYPLYNTTNNKWTLLWSATGRCICSPQYTLERCRN